MGGLLELCWLEILKLSSSWRNLRRYRDTIFTVLNFIRGFYKQNILSELVWFLKTGGTRMLRQMLGLEPFVADINILLEGYQHYTRSVIGSFCLLSVSSLYNHH